ncbi:hypothetical protein APHCRT_0688 [Anaplasma phagocytophilum str. CRT53-1]|uniref:Uncharacterized protein n=1 Tax=Anaplasma phagocytophilum str. CRT53-1 TaxID=1359157 RepID=A0A0F3Q0D3_ANAPH|nr:hypothetical protein APHCRT_0688 [Anaplasma phagocytophilum str. CRT53-1]
MLESQFRAIVASLGNAKRNVRVVNWKTYTIYEKIDNENWGMFIQ